MPPISNSIVFAAPGFDMGRGYINEILRFGQQIRDEWIWDFPLLPGAIYTYQQMAANREWRVSGNPRNVSRAVEWLNSAVTYNSDGVVEYGWHQFESRRVLDYLAVGRTMFLPGDQLEYLDPTEWRYDLDQNEWYSIKQDKRRFAAGDLVVHHPIPLGGTGRFRAPLASIIPTAMLAWLIREHDRASADGRKIRDIFIVIGENIAQDIQDAVEKSLALWAGDDPTSVGVPFINIEPPLGGTAMKASDYVARIGLANIPDNFNRDDFKFEYANEIAATTGMSLRHFWNSEKATNRALEEVQEARQTQKGPSSFVRNEQSLFRDSRALARRFGRNTRMGFLEETDVQSKKTKSEILKNYADALPQFAAAFGGTVNGDAFLGWLQREDILPADIDLITDAGNIENPNELGSPDGNGVRIGSNEEAVEVQKTAQNRQNLLDFGEITMDMRGNVLEQRKRLFTVEKAIEHELMQDVSFVEATANPPSASTDFLDMLREAQKDNYERFMKVFDLDHLEDTDERERMKTILSTPYEDLAHEQHHYIARQLTLLDLKEYTDEL